MRRDEIRAFAVSRDITHKDRNGQSVGMKSSSITTARAAQNSFALQLLIVVFWSSLARNNESQ